MVVGLYDARQDRDLRLRQGPGRHAADRHDAVRDRLGHARSTRRCCLPMRSSAARSALDHAGRRAAAARRQRADPRQASRSRSSTSRCTARGCRGCRQSLAADAPDPYAKLRRGPRSTTTSRTPTSSSRPGTQIVYSNYGAGLLGFALGKKLGGGYPRALDDARARAARPRGHVPHRARGGTPHAARPARTPISQPVPPWTFDALAGAGAADLRRARSARADRRRARRGRRLASSRCARRCGYAGAAARRRRRPNEGLGWQIDGKGRYWHNGGTGGFHSFIGFDPKTQARHRDPRVDRRCSLVDHLADALYEVLDGNRAGAATFPTRRAARAVRRPLRLPGHEARDQGRRQARLRRGPGRAADPHGPDLRSRVLDRAAPEHRACSRSRAARSRDIVFQIGEHQLAAQQRRTLRDRGPASARSSSARATSARTRSRRSP